MQKIKKNIGNVKIGAGIKAFSQPTSCECAVLRKET
jgi:hypothetical protein